MISHRQQISSRDPLGDSSRISSQILTLMNTPKIKRPNTYYKTSEIFEFIDKEVN